ncbi:hypothetical protein SSTU70S_02715 [Stutzerimonas stutzeri]
MLKGLTCQYLLRQTHPLQAGDTVLFHAAAGGVGSIACQWAARAAAATIASCGCSSSAGSPATNSSGGASASSPSSAG